MGRFGYQVVDADGHGGEFTGWQDTVPEKFKPTLVAFREKIKQHYSRLPLPGGGLARHYPGDPQFVPDPLREFSRFILCHGGVV